MSTTLPTTLPILSIEQANYRSITLTFENKLGTIKAGQFVMLWLPGVDEKPVSVAYADTKSIELTVSAVGPWSKEIQKLQVGQKLGLRGPFGNTFKLPRSKKPIVFVGGGFGVAPLYFLAHTAKQLKTPVDFIIGARNEAELLYVAKAKKVAKVHVTTDDGSVGTKGYSTNMLEKLFTKNKYAGVYSCGPEVMMKRVAELAITHKVPSQLSLERYMKCGFGICGSCCLDDSGERVCADGTIFDGQKVLREAEFGNYHRNSYGQKT